MNINRLDIMKNDNWLVWMDLEMTGLNAAEDKIIEIATVVTDMNLNSLETGPEIVVHQNDDVLEKMNDWCKEHHGRSGLTEKVRKSKISVKEAESTTLEFIKQFVKQGKAPLCGNSIHQDRNFLMEYMPGLCHYLHYRNIDVSSIKELTYRWYPDLPGFKKTARHTAMDDIMESIAELKYYREKIFKNDYDNQG